MSERKKTTGLPPGAVIFTGNKKVDRVYVHYLQYDSDVLDEKVHDNHADTVFHQTNEEKVDWYDIRGIHDSELIKLLGTTFNIHPLILEDIADVHQRPKFEEYSNGHFISVRALHFDKSKIEVSSEHVTIYFRKGFLISFQETESDLFHLLRERIRHAKGKVRERGADYLAYAIIDLIVDNYFIVMEDIELVLEEIESNMMANPDESIKGDVHALKKELLVLRKSVAPLREAISRFSKPETSFIEEANRVFIRDLYDHTIQIMDMIDSYRDMLNGIQDLFMSEVSFRMNKVMQLLTLISTIFIPLSFLAGLYGMNFKYMPELEWRYSYHALLIVMAILFFAFLWYFKKKKWF